MLDQHIVHNLIVQLTVLTSSNDTTKIKKKKDCLCGRGIRNCSSGEDSGI